MQRTQICYTLPINLMGVVTPIKFNSSHTAKSPCTFAENLPPSFQLIKYTEMNKVVNFAGLENLSFYTKLIQYYHSNSYVVISSKKKNKVITMKETK